jgi:hypothetical protein
MIPFLSTLRMSKWERYALVLFFVLVPAFGVVVEVRGALLQKRMTDLAVFLRAAWAVRSGADLYAITDDKGLPYNYPPLLAILLTPLADPPATTTGTVSLPFAIKVGLWYVLSVAILAVGLHALAQALEDALPSLATIARAPGNGLWWRLRLWPLLACVAPIGQALSLGQVNILWVALTCGMAAALLRGQSARAGGWLAGAICLKVLPVFLLIYPLWRRDLRCLAGCALGLLAGLVVVPTAVLGPERAIIANRQWAEAVLLPAFGLSADHSRDADLLSVTATHNQAFMATFHKTLYLDRQTRPAQVAAPIRLAHWLLGGTLTGITLLAAGWRRPLSGIAPVLFLGALNVNMLLLSPAGHAHYLALLVPLIMGLLAAAWADTHSRRLWNVLRWLLPLNLLAGALPLLPGMNMLHDLGLPMYAAISLWLMGILLLARWPSSAGRAAENDLSNVCEFRSRTRTSSAAGNVARGSRLTSPGNSMDVISAPGIPASLPPR